MSVKPQVVAFEKYLQPKDYDALLPVYTFNCSDGRKTDEDILRDIMTSLTQHRKFSRTLELGVGTGRMTEIISPYSADMVGIDISPKMVEATKTRFRRTNAEFEAIGIAEYVQSRNLAQYDFICSFWAFNYAMLGFYEKFDIATGKVAPVHDLAAADVACSKFIKGFFEATKPGTNILLMYFDAYSAEQSIVTSLWDKIAPFPYNDRGHTHKMLTRNLRELYNNSSLELLSRDVEGDVLFRDDQHLIDVIFNMHLRGVFNQSPELPVLISEVLNKESIYKNNDGSYSVPAGMRIIQASRL